MKRAVDRASARKDPMVQLLLRRFLFSAVARWPRSELPSETNRKALKFPTINLRYQQGHGLIVLTQAATTADRSRFPFSANPFSPTGTVQSELYGNGPREVGI